MNIIVEKKIQLFLSDKKAISFHLDEVITSSYRGDHIENSIEVFTGIINYIIDRADIEDGEVLVDLRLSLEESVNLKQVPQSFQELNEEYIKYDSIPEMFIAKKETVSQPMISIPKFEYYQSPVPFEIKDLPHGSTGYYSQYRLFEDMLDNENYDRWFNITWML